MYIKICFDICKLFTEENNVRWYVPQLVNVLISPGLHILIMVY
jgi:hypothetical protein